MAKGCRSFMPIAALVSRCSRPSAIRSPYADRRNPAMAHIRLRKFNTRDMYPDQKLDNDLAMVVRAGRHIFLRGQTAMDFDGRIHGIGDPAAQAENAMRCAKILLEEAGSSLDHVCKVTIYITDRAYRDPVYQVVGRW